MYLTPSRFRTMGFGVDVADLTDAELNRYLIRAASALHNHCAVPTLPVPHDFRGGTIVGETHTWNIDPYERDVRRRVFPYHTPIIAVSQVRIYATSNQYLELAAGEIYYEASEGWIEPASANMTSYGLFGAAMLPYIGLAHPHVSLNYTYGRSIPMTERVYYSDAANTWRASTGNWKADAVTVKVNDVVASSGNYVVDRTEGTIKFTAGIPVDGDTVDVTYVGSVHPDIVEAQGIIAAALVTEKALVASGLGGLRAIRVAEISIERDYRRQVAADAPVIPPEAAMLLDPFIFRGLAFG